MSAITAKASRKMKKYAVLTREPRCFLGSFDFSWEQRKLSEITDKVTEKNAGLQYVETFTNSAEFGVISQRDFFDHDIAKLGSLDGYYIVKNEDFVYNPRISTSAPVGPINRNKLGRTGVMSPLYTVFRPHDIDTTYLEYFFKCGYWHSFMNFNGDSGARSDRFSIRDNVFLQMPIPIPDIDEQRKIGELLTCLDNLITLHQRKCVFLFGFFQAFISMIFTASTFSWEQRKLGDVVQITMGQSPDGSTYSDEPSDYILVQGNADLQNGWVCPRIWTTQITKKADAGDLIMSVRAPAGAMGKTAYNAVIGRGVAAIKGNEFIYQLLVKMDADGFWKTLSCGSTFESLNSDNIKNAEVKIPTTAEQIKIGGYFQQLDNLITLHQRECISFTARAGRLILTANKKRNTSSWEQRKLGEMGQTYTGLSGKTKDDFGHGQARFVTYMNVFSNPISNPEMTEPIEIDPKQNEVEVGDVFFTTSSETPEEVGMSSILLEKRGKTYLNSFCFGFRPSEKIDSYYLAYMLRSESTRAKIILLAQGISRYNISKNKVMEIAVSLPSLDEQKMIGQYFSQLDNLITLHQRKPFLMKWRTSDANRNQTNRLVL